MKKVLIISNTCWNAFHYRKSLNLGLVKAGYHVHVLAGFDGFEKNLNEQGIPTTELFISPKGINPFQDLKTLKDILLFLQKYKPDIILSFTIKPVLYTGLSKGILRLFGVGTISIWIPTLTGLGTAFIKSNWITTLVKWLYKLSLNSAKFVVFQNTDDQDLFERLNLVSKKHSKLVPGSGINPQEYPMSISKNEDLTDNNSKLVFLLIARLLWDKGINEYYLAAKKVKFTYPFARFQLLGPIGVQNRTAISEEVIQDWVNEGVIEYIPETLDVRPFIEKCDVVVLPSYREGLPKSLLEGACMGKPLIASDVPGCRDLLINEENGFLCQAKNSESLELAIIKMIKKTNEERFKMGVNSRELVLRKFTEKIVVNKYLDLIKNN